MSFDMAFILSFSFPLNGLYVLYKICFCRDNDMDISFSETSPLPYRYGRYCRFGSLQRLCLSDFLVPLVLSGDLCCLLAVGAIGRTISFCT